jgi:hypothetical protein
MELIIIIFSIVYFALLCFSEAGAIKEERRMKSFLIKFRYSVKSACSPGEIILHRCTDDIPTSEYCEKIIMNTFGDTSGYFKIDCVVEIRGLTAHEAIIMLKNDEMITEVTEKHGRQ